MSIRRPVVAIVASLLMVVFGLYAMTRLPVRETPDIDQSTISIYVNYPGASAEVVESKVIKVIEDQISGVQGIKAIGSAAKDGFGRINLEFIEGRDIDAAANDIRDQVSRVVARLPDDADPPVIQKADPDSNPVITIDLVSTGRSRMELTEYAKTVVQPRLSAIDGVAYVNLFGARQKAMRVWLDRRAMAARNLTVADVQTALRRENVELGAGQLESVDRNFTMRTIRAYQTPEDFSKMVVARGPNNYLIRMGEIGTVELGPVDPYSVNRTGDKEHWGRDVLGMGVVKQPGASTLDVAARVRNEVEYLKKTLPPDIHVLIGNDTSVYIAVALREVTIAMGVAAVLVMLVIYLFLGTVRAAIIPAVTVPISLIATAIVLWPAQFSINILTLLAMVLAIGLVVDDAIIMLENIHRRMKMGEPPLLAAYRGARQVGMAVVSTTMVLVAAFVPVALLSGSVGKLFTEFAVSMAVAVLFSMFISLTLTPVMCSKILSSNLDSSPVSRKSEEIFAKLSAFYRRVLERALDRPAIVASVFAVIVAAAGGLFLILPQEFTPREDRGTFNIQIRAPEGASADYTDRQVRQVSEIIKPYVTKGELRHVIEMVQGGQVSEGSVFAFLTPWDQRERSSTEIVAELAPKLRTVTGAQVAATFPAGLGRNGGGFGGAVQLAIGGPTYDELRVWRDAMMEGLRGNPMFSQVRNNFIESKPQIRIRVDRTRAADLGVSVGAIGETLQAMLGSRKATTFVDRGEEYDVMLQGSLEDRRTPTDVSNIFVRSETTGQLIPLSSLVTMEEGSYADGLNRFNRRRAINVNVFPRPDVLLGDVVNEVERVAREKLPPTAELTWRGEAGEFKDNSAMIYFSFALALVVVFLVLAAQFESFVHPLVIMMTVPLAVTGALGGLLIFGQSINLYSQIGIIVLVGLAAKNGILIVEFTNQLRDAGRPFREALVQASLIRLRPIIMTALATVMGALPLMLATGAGSEGRRPIGVVIFTGVSFAVIITLVVVPAFYMLLARRTGSPGRVAAELRAYEKTFPQGGAKDSGHQPAE
ncbi:MAG: efflux RND transporter permease subunit [Rhodospirillaceae bacterium]|nr:efflux RND transporter permease subunit [Rhodospirillaceae bacterium]